MDISPQERAALAAKVGVHEQYLYQCLTRRRQMDAAEAMRVERASDGRLRRWHLRFKDWNLIWPELLDDPDAPKPVDLEAEPAKAA